MQRASRSVQTVLLIDGPGLLHCRWIQGDDGVVTVLEPSYPIQELDGDPLGGETAGAETSLELLHRQLHHDVGFILIGGCRRDNGLRATSPGKAEAEEPSPKGGLGGWYPVWWSVRG
jgi:hypothetical protein